MAEWAEFRLVLTIGILFTNDELSTVSKDLSGNGGASLIGFISDFFLADEFFDESAAPFKLAVNSTLCECVALILNLFS